MNMRIGKINACVFYLLLHRVLFWLIDPSIHACNACIHICVDSFIYSFCPIIDLGGDN